MRFAVVVAALVVAVGATYARASTCTITAAYVYVKYIGAPPFPLPTMIGYAIPATVAESAGTIQVDLTSLPVGDFNIQGVDNSLDLSRAGSVMGRIDGAGNVYLPPLPVDFTTAFVPGAVLSADEPLTTGIAVVTLAGVDYPTEGASLDFATGAMRIEGQGVIPNAPFGPATSGISLACILEPIPAQDQLPKGPSVVANAVTKPGKPGDPGTVVGDEITFKAKLKNGAALLDPTQDFFVRLLSGGTEILLIHLPAGALSGGKKLTASDTDGKTLRVVVGRKQVGAVVADVAGSIVVTKSKKGLAMLLKESGLDFSGLVAGDATLTVGVGPVAASDAVTVKPGAKKTVLK